MSELTAEQKERNRKERILREAVQELAVAFRSCTRATHQFRIQASGELAPLALETLNLSFLADFVREVHKVLEKHVPDGFAEDRFEWHIGKDNSPVLYLEIFSTGMPSRSPSYDSAVAALKAALEIAARGFSADEYTQEERVGGGLIYRFWWD